MTFHFGNSFGRGSTGTTGRVWGGGRAEVPYGRSQGAHIGRGWLAEARTLLGSHTEASSLHLSGKQEEKGKSNH